MNKILLLLPLTLVFSLRGALQLHDAGPKAHKVDWQVAFKKKYTKPEKEFIYDQEIITKLENMRKNVCVVESLQSIKSIIPDIATMDIHEFLHEIQHLDVPLKNELLINSAGCGILAAVRALLKNGADVNHADSNGNTALIMAAHYGHTGIVELLLKNEVNVNAQNYIQGSSALYLAVMGSYYDIVRLLLEWGANDNLANITGETPLALAIRLNNSNLPIDAETRLDRSDIVELMLEYRANDDEEN